MGIFKQFKDFKKGMGEAADTTSALSGRTVVEFETAKNVWEIADAWAAQYNSQPVERSDTHRLYRIDSGMGLMLGVEIDTAGTGYKMQGWMEPPQVGAVSTGLTKMMGMPGDLIPKEMRLDAAAVPGGMVMSNKPGMMFNQLLQALGVEQQIQAISPQFQPPQ